VPERELLSIPEPLEHQFLCEISSRWLVTPDVMAKTIRAAQEFRFNTSRDVFIISGWRSARQQARLGRQGRPTAPDELSTHRTCLATGIDIDLGFLVPRVVIATWGTLAVLQGLRWGGGSPVDPETLLPTDWPHVDLGPRVPVSATP